MPLAPAAAELVVILSLLFLVALLYTYRLTVAYVLEHTLGALPVIGGRVSGAIDGALDRVEQTLRNWLASSAHTLVGWLSAIADYSADLYDELRLFAVQTAQSFDHAIHVTVHDIVKAFLKPVWAVVNPLVKAVDDIAGSLDRLRERVISVELPRINAELDKLGNGIDTLRRETIPNLRRETFAGIDALKTTLGSVVLPRIGSIEAELPSFRIGIRDLRDALNTVREWVGPLSAAIPTVLAIALLRHVRECKPKTERLCQLDPMFLDELLALAFIVPHLDEIRNVVRESARAANGLVDEISDSLGR